jgi:hypothetical protein
MTRFLHIAALLGFAATAFGESGQNAAPQGPSRGTSSVQIWDDRVFDLEPKAPPPETRKGASGAERYLGPDADYNRGQRDRWLEACEPMKNVDLRAYRDCFAQEKRKSGEKLQLDRAEVEGRSSLPLRNVPGPVYDEPPRNPAFDAQVERTEE